jgi:hypothetical protein
LARAAVGRARKSALFLTPSPANQNYVGILDQLVSNLAHENVGLSLAVLSIWLGIVVIAVLLDVFPDGNGVLHPFH